MDNEQLKNAAEREADEALEAILNEIDAKPRESEAGSAAADEAPRRRRPVSEDEAPRRRRPVSADEAPRRRRPVSADEAPQRRRPVSADEAPQRRRPVSADEAPQRRRPAAERAPQQRPAAKRPTSGSGSRSSAAVRRRPNYFRIGMLIYIIVFMLITMFIMHKLYVYLGEYEQSRPQYTIDGYVTSLNNGFYTDMIRQTVDGMQVSVYETAETISENLNVDAINTTGYTWVKDVKDFTDDKPVYYIRSGEAAIAKVTLEKSGGTPSYDFPIWKVCAPESLVEIASEPQYSLDVTVPAGGSVMVNGVAVPDESFVEGTPAVQLDTVALNVAQQPSAKQVVLNGLYVAPKVQAFDAEGNALEAAAQPEETEKNQVYSFEPKSEAVPDPQIVTRVEDMMRAYINYMINKDDDRWTNIGYLDNYLIRGSNAYTKLHGVIDDVMWNNPYDSRTDRALDVKEVKMYSDNVFTCEVYYDYQLTKKVVNDYSGTIKWTFVKNGNVWSATDFAILSSNDNNFAETGDGTGEGARVDASDET